jgi:hypothetical protein
MRHPFSPLFVPQSEWKTKNQMLVKFKNYALHYKRCFPTLGLLGSDPDIL